MSWRDRAKRVEPDTVAAAPKPSWRDRAKPVEPETAQEESLSRSITRAALDGLPIAGGMVGGFIGGTAAGVPTLGLGAPGGAIVGGATGTALGQAARNAALGYFFPEEAPQNVAESVGDTALAGAVGALGEGAGQVVSKVAVPAIRAAGSGIQSLRQGGSRLVDKGLAKLGNVISNVPEEVSKEYLERQGDITARELPEIAEDIRGAVAGQKQKLEGAKQGVDAARFGVTQARASAQEAKQLALEGLKSRRLTQLTGDLGADLDVLKQMVKEGSEQSYKILDEVGGEVSTRPILNKLDEAINAQFVMGKTGPTLPTAEAEATVKALQDLKQRLEPLGGTLELSQAKRLIQAYDRTTGYGLPGFDDAVNATKKQARRALSEAIKDQVPQYRKVMESVSADTDLYNDLVEQGFADPQKLFSKLQGVASDKGRAFVQPQIEKLSSRVGSDYYDQLDEYFAAQNVLQSPAATRQLLQELPEQRALAQAGQQLDAANQGARAAQEAFRKVQPFQSGVEAKIRGVRGARSADITNQFKNLEQVTGRQFLDEARDRALLEQFKKSDVQGSRKVALGAVLGGKAGAVAGFIQDRVAGRVLKGILDGKIILDQTVVEFLTPDLGKYAQPLAEAAARGAQSLAITQYLLSKHDPEFRKLQQGEDQGN